MSEDEAKQLLQLEQEYEAKLNRVRELLRKCGTESKAAFDSLELMQKQSFRVLMELPETIPLADLRRMIYQYAEPRIPRIVVGRRLVNGGFRYFYQIDQPFYEIANESGWNIQINGEIKDSWICIVAPKKDMSDLRRSYQFSICNSSFGLNVHPDGRVTCEGKELTMGISNEVLNCRLEIESELPLTISIERQVSGGGKTAPSV